MYRDPLFIPSRALAIALAEEWDAQMDTIDMRQMHLNTMMAKGVRSTHDDTLPKYMHSEARKIFTNDQICFFEPVPEYANATEYKEKLRKRQIKMITPIFDTMKQEYGINMKEF